MRILHVVPSYVPAWRYGGPIRSVHGLARAQVEAGDHVEVFTTDADGPSRLDVSTGHVVEIDGVKVWYFRRGFPARIFRAPGLGDALREHVIRFDAVHIHSVFLWPTRKAARAAARAEVPYFVSPRGMLVGTLIQRRGSLRKRLWIRFVERKTLGRAAGIVLQSDSEKRELQQFGIDLAPVHVVPNGVDFEEIEKEKAEPAPASLRALIRRKPYVLFLGRLSWKKGIERLIEAMADVPEARLVIAGNDDEGLGADLERSAARAGLAERTHLAGEVQGGAKWALLEGAAVLCLPSISENFGNVVIEAFAAGLPVVVTKSVGASELVTRADCGLVVDGTAAALSRGLRDLVTDPARAEALGRNGLRFAQQELSWGRIAQDVGAIYQRALGRPGQRMGPK